jgi:hypothetical protein
MIFILQENRYQEHQSGTGYEQINSTNHFNFLFLLFLFRLKLRKECAERGKTIYLTLRIYLNKKEIKNK